MVGPADPPATITEPPIVNAHPHFGDVRQSHDSVVDWDVTVEHLIAAMDEHHVDATILKPPGGANGREVRAARILGGNAIDLYDLEVEKQDFTEAPVLTTS